MRTTAARMVEPDQLERRLELLERRVRQLEAASVRGPRDEADVALVLAIASAIGSARFTGLELFRHADVHEGLAAALEDADLDNPRQLGRLLRRVAGHDVAGFVVQPAGQSRDGLVWSVRVCESGNSQAE
jgi:hypothetical protein